MTLTYPDRQRTRRTSPRPKRCSRPPSKPQNPDIKIEIETRPGGSEGDNLVKTRLATGEMTDVFLYNAGSLFQALNPPQNLVDLTDEPFQANVIDSLQAGRDGNDGKVYGAPMRRRDGRRHPLQQEDLPRPRPVGPEDLGRVHGQQREDQGRRQGAGDPDLRRRPGPASSSFLATTTTCRPPCPNFAADYTANKAKYATTPAAMKGFERQEEVFKAGYLNEDFAAATFDDGVRMVATGEGAHYPMLTFAIGAIAAGLSREPQRCRLLRHARRRCRQERPDGLDAGGALHRQDHRAPRRGQEVRGLRRQRRRAATSQTAADRRHRPLPGQGLHAARPTCRRRSPTCCPTSRRKARTAPALEFLSPIKGPALEQITVEVGSGIRSAADGAALYDEDVKKQAQQLGLPGW